MITVTKQLYPLLYECLAAIDGDNGRPIRETYNVPNRFEEIVSKAELVLNMLTPQEREALAFGSEEDCKAVRTRGPMYEELDKLFTSFFLEWADTDSDVPHNAPNGMTKEEAYKVITDGEPHASVTYYLAAQVLGTQREYALADIAESIARMQNKAKALTEKIDKLREEAKQVKMVNAQGTSDDILLIVDGAYGIYAPQTFCERMNFKDFCGVDQECWDILLEGPKHDLYWEAWDELMSNASIVLDPATYNQKPGRYIRYYVWQDGDIWLVPEGVDPDAG